MDKCTICGSFDTRLCSAKYPGYVEGTAFDIYSCNQCAAHFVPPHDADEKIYEMIYGGDTPGYDRYRVYADKVKSHPFPLKYLSDTEASYFPVYQCLGDSAPCNILEVGCGYGYLTFALRSLGHNAWGIDVSRKAIRFARENFGDYYEWADIQSFKSRAPQQFDFIVAIEVIEHVPEPGAFIDHCRGLLAENGLIIISTPNKDFASRGVIWQTDPPPVHMVWLGHKSFVSLANNKDMGLTFIDYKTHYPSRENKLITYMMSRGKFSPRLSVVSNGGVAVKRWTGRPIARLIKSFFVDLPPVRYLFNFIFNLLGKEQRVLSPILTKRKEGKGPEAG